MRADIEAGDFIQPAPPPPAPIPPPPPPQLPPTTFYTGAYGAPPAISVAPTTTGTPVVTVDPAPAPPLPPGVDDVITADNVPAVPDEIEIPEGEEREDSRQLAASYGNFWTLLLRYIHAPVTKTNVRALNAWADSEGMPAMANNPLAIRRTTLDSKPYPPSPQVQMYPSVQEGAYALSRTMLATPGSKIVAALRDGKSLMAIYKAVNASGWRPGAQNGHYPVDLYNFVYGNVAPKDDSGPVQKPLAPPARIGQSSSSWRNLMSFYKSTWPNAGKHASTMAGNILKGVK